MRTRSTGLALVALLLCAAFAADLAAQAPPSPGLQSGGRGRTDGAVVPPGPYATFEVRAYGTSRAGASPAGSASGIGRLPVGDSRLFGLSEIDFEGVGSSGWPVPEGFPLRLDDKPHVRRFAWRVEVKLVSIEIDEARLELTWGRYDRTQSLSEPVAGGTSTLTLRAGQGHTLDLVHSPVPSSVLENVVVDLTLKAVNDPAHPDVGFNWDLWLVHRDAAGRKITRHIEVRGYQGEQKEFSFQPIGFTLDGAVEPVQDSRADLADVTRMLGTARGQPRTRTDYEPARVRLHEVEDRLAELAGQPTAPAVDLTVNGTMSARLRPDGSIEVGLTAERWMRCVGGGAGGGDLRAVAKSPLAVKSGETVAFSFPTYDVFCGMPSGTAMPPNARQGVELRDGIVWVDAKKFLANQDTSLLMTVTRLR